MTWPVVTLDSIKADVPYACVGGPFGSNLTSKHYVDEGVPVIRGQNLGGPGCFNETGFVFVTPEKADKLRPNLAFRGDLLFTQRGTLGQVGLIPKDSHYERYVVSQSQMKLTVDANRVDARFVYQYFRLPSTIQEILNRTITAGVPHINLGILKAFEIPLPPAFRSAGHRRSCTKLRRPDRHQPATHRLTRRCRPPSLPRVVRAPALSRP